MSFVFRGGRGLDHLWEAPRGRARPEVLGFAIHRVGTSEQRMYLVSSRPSRRNASSGAHAAGRGPQPQAVPCGSLLVSPVFSLSHATRIRPLPHHQHHHHHAPCWSSGSSSSSAAAAAAPDPSGRPRRAGSDGLVTGASPSALSHPATAAAAPAPAPGGGGGHPALLDMAGVTRKGTAAAPGGKPFNQDRALLLERWRAPGEALVGVLDGHGGGGHLVAAWLAAQLPGLLLAHSLHEAACLPAAAPPAAAAAPQGHQGPRRTPSATEGLALGLAAAATSPRPSSHGATSACALLAPAALLPPAWLCPPDAAGAGGLLPPPSPAAFTAAFLDADGLLATDSGLGCADSGSTAVLVHLGAGDTLTAAWVGDSRAVLGRRDAAAQGGAAQQRQQQQQPSAPAAPPLRRSNSPLHPVAPSCCPSSAAPQGPDWMNLEGGEAHDPDATRATAPQATPAAAAAAAAGGGGGGGGGGAVPLGAGWSALPLTRDHKPDRPDELARIAGAGGRVAQYRTPEGVPVGPWRVWYGGVDYPGLAMSRAFGDTPCKAIGVTASPETSVTRLAPGDEVLVVASDGVWEYVSNAEAVALAGEAPSAAHGAAALVEAAEARWRRRTPGYIDDITAVVVRLRGPPGGATTATATATATASSTGAAHDGGGGGGTPLDN